MYRRLSKREKGRERERERVTRKKEDRERKRQATDRERKGVCRGAHDFLHILRRLLSVVEDNQAATSTNDPG